MSFFAAALAVSCGAAVTMNQASTGGAQAAEATPREFGAIHWGRKLEPALLKAAAAKKPVMLLFQEVPG